MSVRNTGTAWWVFSCASAARPVCSNCGGGPNRAFAFLRQSASSPEETAVRPEWRVGCWPAGYAVATTVSPFDPPAGSARMSPIPGTKREAGPSTPMTAPPSLMPRDRAASAIPGSRRRVTPVKWWKQAPWRRWWWPQIRFSSIFWPTGEQTSWYGNWPDWCAPPFVLVPMSAVARRDRGVSRRRFLSIGKGHSRRCRRRFITGSSRRPRPLGDGPGREDRLLPGDYPDRLEPIAPVTSRARGAWRRL